MPSVFNKLKLKDQTEILVMNAPASFEGEVASLSGVRVLRALDETDAISFVLAFVTTKKEVDAISVALPHKVKGDGLIWMAYPKGSSKKYKCDFNRDTGWEILGQNGFERVSQVAIDEDWSALRFRRVEFILSMTRRESFALTPQGKEKAKKKQEG